MNVRNVAIIAHVDHGKTTLVDAILRQTNVFRKNQDMGERVLDRNELERERGITILAKNVSVMHGDCKINIVDTPGHADFGGEVERILGMVDGALLVVDAVEGPMPQTRFVLAKALSHGLAPIVVINKVDRPLSRPDWAVDQVFDLFVTLGANDRQLDFPVFYASALTGRSSAAWETMDSENGTILPVLDGIVTYVPPPAADEQAPLQLLVSNLDYDDYTGRLAIGRISAGQLLQGQEVSLCRSDHEGLRSGKVGRIYSFDGLKRTAVQQASAGDIVAFSGIENIQIGDTVTSLDAVRPLPAIKVDEPTLTMIFRVNDGPLASDGAEHLTSRQLRERLLFEARVNVALRVEETNSPDSFQVSGRGELHLSVLIETMRRQKYSFCVTRPKPILRRGENGVEEPFEKLSMDIPQDYLGAMMEMVGERRGELQSMESLGPDRLRAEFLIPARGLVGFSSPFLTETRGNGIMHHSFSHYASWAGSIPGRGSGSLVALEKGIATGYALENLEQRGTLFIGPGTEIYAGMVIGENSRPGDLVVNAAKKKQATNIRAAGSDDAVKLAPPRIMSLEQAISHLADDEFLEVTPKALRLRKAILDHQRRERAEKTKSVGIPEIL